MNYKYDVSEHGLKGFVDIETLDYPAMIKAQQEIIGNAKPDSNGNFKVEIDQAKYASYQYDLVKKQTKDVSVSHKKLKINSIDDLGRYKEGIQIINKLGAILIHGIPLGNEQEPT